MKYSLQTHWRGNQVRAENIRQNHPIVTILQRIRSKKNSSLTLQKRMMQIVQEFSDVSVASLTAYLL
jgi:hypothetical protein